MSPCYRHDFETCDAPGSIPMEICANSKCHALEGPSTRCDSMDEVLPAVMLMEILSRLPSACDLVRCAAVSSAFLSAFRVVTNVHFICKLEDIRKRLLREPFKKIVTKTLNQLKCVEQLRLEVEDEMQGRKVKEDGIEKHSLWLSKTDFADEWLLPVSSTLKILTVIDYGQQAIYHASYLLQLLSQRCKQLQSLELRNMYLATSLKTDKLVDKKWVVGKMWKITTLTLRCVKLTDTGLKDLNDCMPNLETLTLVTVVGLKEAEFTSEKLKVLCLGLATRVNSVKLDVKHLVKLQLKMPGPEKLNVIAPNLQCLAMCMDKRESRPVVVFEGVKLLRELLMGASEFNTLNTLCKYNRSLDKMFLDVPCMAFQDSGKWSAVLSHVPLDVPDMDVIRSCCPNLSTLSVGPGLWYALEDVSLKKDVVANWPTLTRLIVHMIVLPSNEPSMAARSLQLLSALVEAIHSLSSLEVYVHVDSVIGVQEFHKLNKQFPLIDVKCDNWKKGLRFECFSF